MHQIAELNPAISELALARAWADGAHPNQLIARDGAVIEVIYRGIWTHGFGPDFSEAMIAWSDGRLETGAIELHLRTSGWRDHGHHQDPAYDTVMLHVVGIDDGAETRRSDGKLVPVVAVGLEHAQAIGRAFDWTRVGGEVCAADLARDKPGLIVDALRTLGDSRIAELETRFEADLELSPPAQVLWTALLDVFGLMENREPMRKLTALLPIADLERAMARASNPRVAVAALLFGMAGFLPFAPRDAETSGIAFDEIRLIEAHWLQCARPTGETVSPGEWRLTRVRPANHPVARLATAAELVSSSTNGLASTLLDPIRNAVTEPRAALQALNALAPNLGLDRATVLVSRVLIPFALALAQQTGDQALTDGAMFTWDALPASAHNHQTRAAMLQISGGPALRSLGERGMYGLIQLHRTRCGPRRCFECPIAAMVVGGQ